MTTARYSWRSTEVWSDSAPLSKITGPAFGFPSGPAHICCLTYPVKPLKHPIPALLFFLLLLCSGCNPGQPGTSGDEAAPGGIYTGGTLRVNETQRFRNLMPLAIHESADYHITSQVYEGLLRYNPRDLSLLPGLARSWELSPDRKEYTFHLRTDVRFHDDSCFKDGKGRLLTAHDVLYCFENLCSHTIDNHQYELSFKDRVEGANAFFAESRSGRIRPFSGISVLNDSTLRIRLEREDPGFLHVLAMPGCYIYPKEALARYGEGMRSRCIGTGPFYMDALRADGAVVLKKNTAYWGRDKYGNPLPYLDGIHWTFLPDKKSEIRAFRQGHYDLICHIPVDLFRDISGNRGQGEKGIDFDIYSAPALSSHFYGFNLQQHPLFSVREIRQAFNLAIDRDKIAYYALNAATYGIIPYTEVFLKQGYPYSQLRGYAYDPDSARRLLSRAGYPNGKGLPEFNLQISSLDGDRDILVALAVQNMLRENLGVTINMSIVSGTEHLSSIRNGDSDFFHYTCQAAYPDPEAFLSLFHGRHVPASRQESSPVNFSRFSNPLFDSVFDAARSETLPAKRAERLARAEQILLDEAVCIPLFYDEYFRLVQKNVRNLPENAMNYMDMSTTYFVPLKK